MISCVFNWAFSGKPCYYNICLRFLMRWPTDWDLMERKALGWWIAHAQLCVLNSWQYFYDQYNTVVLSCWQTLWFIFLQLDSALHFIVFLHEAHQLRLVAFDELLFINLHQYGVCFWCFVKPAKCFSIEGWKMILLVWFFQCCLEHLSDIILSFIFQFVQLNCWICHSVYGRLISFPEYRAFCSVVLTWWRVRTLEKFISCCLKGTFWTP